MLILTRKKNEEIIIDGVIKFKILHAGKTCKIGVTAPEHILIQRAELLDESKDNNNKVFMRDQAKGGVL